MRKQILAKLPKELRVSVAEVAAISPAASTAAVQYVLAGPDLEAARRRYAAKMEPELKKNPARVDVDTTLITGKPELRVAIDRDRAADLGVSVADVADTLRLLVGGVEGVDLRRGRRAVRRPPARREGATAATSALALLTVPSRKYGTVPLVLAS